MSGRRLFARAVTVALLSLVLPAAHAESQSARDASGAPVRKPSRAPQKGCRWESLNGAGLAVWVERCNFGTRKIDLFFKGNALVQRYSDGGRPDTVIDVIDLLPAETQLAGVARVVAIHAGPAVSRKCVVAPYKGGGRPPAGTAFYTFVPNANYEKALARSKNTDVPEPPCGDWGFAPDGIQYFEIWPALRLRKILFVRAGQDTPLFDERTLELKPL